MSIPVLRATLVVVSLMLLVVPPAVSSAAMTATQRAASVTAACLVGLAVLLVRAPVVSERITTVGPTAPDARPDDSAAPADLRAVPVGRAVDGDPIVLDAAAGIAVVGHGALALAVFVAISVSLARCGVPDTAELRTALADDLEPDGAPGALPGSVRRAGTGLTTGTAVSVLVDESGIRRASVVLVPDLRTVPRQAGPAIDVTRYGCTARVSPRAATGVHLVPALPVLSVPLAEPAGAGSGRRAR